VGALPLLQYTLDLLWTKDDITDRVLNTKAYQELGGVTGALQQQADKIYDKFDETQQKLAKEIFLELIELGGKEAVSRRADKGIFERDETQREVLYQLIDNRLLVSKGEDGKATVEVAHEELIRSWKVLQDLIREKEEIIILRNRLYADAKSWQDAQKASSELWNGSKLARIVEFKKEQALPNLDGVTIEFIEASMAERDRLQKVEIERQKRDKRTAQRIAAGSLVAVVLVGGFGLMALNEKNTAEQRQNIVIKYLVSEPQRLLENNKQLEALMSIVDSLKVLKNMGGDNSITLGQLKSIMNKIWQRNHLNKHQAPVFGISFSPDGQRILSGGADGKIIVWNTNGVIEKEFTILGISPQVWGVAFSGDSKKVIAATSERDGNGLGKDGVIKVWDLSTKSVNLTKPVNLLGHKHGVVAITTSPNCDIIASSGEDATIRLWNINLQKQYQIREDKEVNKDNGTIYSTDFSPDCQYIASTGYFDGSVKIWDLNSRQEFIHSNPVQELKFDNLSEDKKNLYPNIVSSVNFSSDGTMLAAANYGGFVRIWNTKTWKKIIEFKAHHDQIYGMAFSPDSKFIASASREVRRSLVLWTLKGKEVGIFKGHTQAVNQVKFQRRNDKNANYLIASSSDDGTVGLWSINPDKSKTPEKLNEDILLHESCLSLRDYLITNKDIAPPERRRICDPVLESHLK
jgi:WD40 repeat protein